jgi:hypothetical protein
MSSSVGMRPLRACTAVHASRSACQTFAGILSATWTPCPRIALSSDGCPSFCVTSLMNPRANDAGSFPSVSGIGSAGNARSGDGSNVSR